MKNINFKELFKNKSVIYLSVILGLLLVIGVSYAYFSITVNGNEEAQDIRVTTGNLSLFYNSGPELKVDNIEPGKILIKEFTVTNTGDFDTEFDINMVDMINTIEKDELVYTLDCVSYEKYGQEGQTEIGTCDGQGTTPFIYSEVPTSQKLKGNNLIKTGITNKYTLTITFNETGSVQNYNQGKKFIGKIQINEYNYNDSNVPVINNAKIDNLLLTALLKDSTGLNAYAVTNADAERPSSWKNVSNKEYTVSDRVDDYDKKLWVKNIDGNVIYKDLTPISNLTIDPAGGTYNGSTGSITTSERYKNEIELSDPTREGYTFSGWNVTGERSTLKDSSTAMLINKIRMMSTRLAEGNSSVKTLIMGIEETKVTATWRQNNYDLTINPNGGSYNGSTEAKTSSVLYGTDVNIDTPVREGYTFAGWSVSSNLSKLNGNVLTMGLEDCTLTANWVVNTYPWIAYHNKMNVNGNGYTLVSADTKEGTADFGSKVTPNVNTYTGFTSPSTKTITIVVDTKPSTKNVVNYNYDRNKYTLTINPNGGTYNGSTSSTTTSEYFEAVKTIKSPTKTGYTFKNWSKTGNSTLTDTTLTIGSENTILTANYEANKYTVYFNANGGNVDPSSIEVTYDNTYGTLPVPTREGHEFLGWFTDASSGAQVIDSTPVSIVANQTLYAHWNLTNLTYNLVANNYTCGGSNANSYISFTGACTLLNDGNGNWRMKLLSSGTLTVSNAIKIDAFLVGGGGGGAGGGYFGGGAGGGGGYVGTYSGITISNSSNYAITIGAGGAGGASQSAVGGTGGTTSAFGYAVNGGTGGNGMSPGNGGSGGGTGGADNGQNCGGDGGSNGSNGGTRNAWNAGLSSTAGVGSGVTTKEFETGDLYAGGGGGACVNSQLRTDVDGGSPCYNGGSGGAGGGGRGAHIRMNPVAGTANTGGGGGGGTGWYSNDGTVPTSCKIGAAGGSGVVVIRNAR